MDWLDDRHGGWRCMVEGRFVAEVVHHLDGWRGFLNATGQAVPGAPHSTLEDAQAAVVEALRGGYQLGT